MTNVNLFFPLNPGNPEYENRLTWAFLGLLKYDPFLQNFLRELVMGAQNGPNWWDRDNTWEPACVSTQVRQIGSSTRRLVSVLLTDERLPEPVGVEWSDRNNPVYDGVVEYPNDLILIIENKLWHGDVWEGQLQPSRGSFPRGIKDVDLHEWAICLEWSEVLEGVLKYADSRTASFASGELVRDFLSFVEKIHPELTPYRKFSLCGDKLEALNRRVICLLNDLTNNREDLGRRRDPQGLESISRRNCIAERIVIGIEKVENHWKLWMGIWPANTVSQARRFYPNVNQQLFLQLQGDDYGWTIKPYLHFSFMGTCLVQAKTKLKVQEYLNYFQNEEYGQIAANEDTLLPLVEQWKEKDLISLADQQEIIDKFINTDRQHINVIPGFEVYRNWDLDKVIEWEEGNLEEQIRDVINTVLETWGEKL